MVDINKENKSWHQDHAAWVNEVEQWQHDTNRLVALLYQLERSLPEHTAMLVKHVSLIEQHEKLINTYEYVDADGGGLHSYAESKSLQQQAESHHKLSCLHDEVRQEHMVLKKNYTEEMKKFKLLLGKLLKEC